MPENIVFSVDADYRKQDNDRSAMETEKRTDIIFYRRNTFHEPRRRIGQIRARTSFFCVSGFYRRSLRVMITYYNSIRKARKAGGASFPNFNARLRPTSVV